MTPPQPSPGVEGGGATPPQASGAGQRALDRALVSGLGWTWLSSWGTQLVSWSSTILVARLLTPADYGVVAMATLFLGLTRMMSEFGLGTTVLAMRDLTERDLAEINGLSLMLGLVALLLALAAAVPLGHFFASDELPTVVAVMALGFLIAAVRVVPHALLQRELRFDTLARLEVVQALTMTATTLTLAWLGAGYWALALGPMAGQGVAAFANARLYPVGVARPSRSIANAIRLSRNILVERLAGYGYSSADSLIIGRVLGDSPLGLYTLARSLGTIAADKVTGMTMRVTPAVFAAAQHDPGALRRYLYTLTEGLAVATFPICAGTALVAGEFVPLFLGSEWAHIVLPLQLVSLQGVIPAITAILPQILVVTGQSAFVMRNGLFSLVVVPLILLAGVRYGVSGVAAAWFVCLPIVRAPLFWRTRQQLDLRVRLFVRALWPAVSSTGVMALAVLATASLLEGHTSLTLLFAAKVGAGGLAYAAALLTLHRARLQDAWRTIRDLRSARPAEAPSPLAASEGTDAPLTPPTAPPAAP